MASKFFLKSKSILGGLLTALPILAPAFGIGSDDVHLVNQTVDQVVSLSGLLMVIYGRIKADGRVSFLP